MATSEDLFEEVGSVEELGGGAYFWAYVSAENNTPEIVKDWTVTLRQGDWSASIDSSQQPPALKTKGMSGVFQVEVVWRTPPAAVLVELRPAPGSRPEIGCNENCGAMIAIAIEEPRAQPTYTTTWDAICRGAAGEG